MAVEDGSICYVAGRKIAVNKEEIDAEVERSVKITLNLSKEEVAQAVKDYAIAKIRRFGVGGNPGDVSVSLKCTTYGDFDCATVTFTSVDRTDSLR